MGTSDAGLTLTADGIAMRLRALGGESVPDAGAGRREADLILELDAGLRAGYRGLYGCNA